MVPSPLKITKTSLVWKKTIGSSWSSCRKQFLTCLLIKETKKDHKSQTVAFAPHQPAMASLRITSFMSLVFLSFSCSYADESITNTQPLTTWETKFSPNRIYALGFFTTATTSPSSCFYLGIWLSNDTQRQAVWVANRENPIRSSSPSLKISNSGNLIISSNGMTDICITNATGTSTNTSAKLLDNGNLVLLEGANGDSTGRILWQSFDHPTDTLLPGMKLRQTQFLTSWLNNKVPYPGAFTLGIDPNGANQFVIWYRGGVYWKSRVWNSSEHVQGVFNNQPYNIHYRFESDEDGKYFIYTINQPADDDNFIYKWAMTSSGQISRDQWHTVGSSGFWSKVEKMNGPCNGTFEDDGCRRRAWPNCSATIYWRFFHSSQQQESPCSKSALAGDLTKEKPSPRTLPFEAEKG